MLASGVFANVFTTDFAYSRQDLNGSTFGNELYRIGYLGIRRAGAHKLAAMFELHIEQGPILFEERKTIGVVTGVQGMRWYEVTVSGQHAHAGATPMHLRRDALLGAARLIDRIDAVARRFVPSAVATVGFVECRPNSRNTIPGEIFFTVDLRHPEDAVLDVMEWQMRSALRAILEPMQLIFDEKCIWKSPAIAFDPQLIQCVTRAAGQAGYPARQIVSGAGHDSVYIARVAPTAMIFVPCLDGLSHNEAESATLEDCAAGTQVLLNAVLDFDRHMGSS